MLKYLFFIFLFSSYLNANWKSDREELENMYIKNEFRIFYSLFGKNKLIDISDLNNNNTPDFIDNLSLQLNKSNILFSNKLKLKKPLDNDIYTKKAKYIDIHVLKLQKGLNGSAGDTVIKYKYKILNNKQGSISISISHKISKNNLTPSHELFHVYLNAYSMIKNSWYSEGIARLMEDELKINKTVSEKLPSTNNELNRILSNTYLNSKFWKRLDEKCNTNVFINHFLLNLSKQDILIENKYNYQQFKWKESDQKSKKNNPYILNAIKKTIINNCHNKSDEELVKFLNIIN